jgi:glycosyltransferase involved in cell wall biosynthesis
LKILQVTPGYYPVIGGVERHVEALSERLAMRGHDVTVATMTPRGVQTAPAEETRNYVSIRRFRAVGIGDAYRLPLGLARFLSVNRNRWDVVHVHNYHAALIPLVPLAGVRPFVVTTHLNDTPHSAVAGLLHVPYGVVGRWGVRQADAVICVTSAEAERVSEQLGALRARTIVIPNGVSQALVAAGSDVAGDRDPYLLLAVGRLQAYKRVEDALRALALLEEPYRLAIIGNGPQRPQLEQMAATLGVASRVQFVGRAGDEDLVGWYRRAGFVLNLSEAEAFGMTVLEGVAAGCEAVCSNIPAFHDLASQFPDHVTVVTGRRDPESVAAAVRLAARRTTSAPADVNAFTWDAVTERVLDVYRDVAGVVEKVGGGRTLAEAQSRAPSRGVQSASTSRRMETIRKD